MNKSKEKEREGGGVLLGNVRGKSYRQFLEDHKQIEEVAIKWIG